MLLAGTRQMFRKTRIMAVLVAAGLRASTLAPVGLRANGLRHERQDHLRLRQCYARQLRVPLRHSPSQGQEWSSSLTAVPDRARRVPTLLALIAAAFISGCGLGQPPEGPLGVDPENTIKLSQPVVHGGADTIGFDAVTNSGSVPAVIDRLVIRSPRHIKLIGAYVTIGGPIGDWTTYPPVIGPKEGDAFRWWSNRHKPAGAVIPPGKLAGIALGLKVTSAKGSVAGINLFYHVGQAHYEWHGHIRIVLTSVDCRAPSSAPAQNFCRLFERRS
jgi:hypothetical protein